MILLLMVLMIVASYFLIGFIIYSAVWDGYLIVDEFQINMNTLSNLKERNEKII